MKLTLFVTCAGTALAAVAAPVELREGDRVAFFGDSITHQASYSAMLETYFELCTGVKGLTFMQFGWCGDTAGHARTRMANDVLAWKATVSTILFGVNDGKYKPYDEGLAMTYKTNLTEMVRAFKQAGVRPVLASPPSMDPSHGDSHAFVDALTRMGEKGREVAASEGTGFADVNRVHRQVQDKALAEYGKKCKFSGDGVHGYPASHFLIFHGFLEGFRLDGQIASIAMDAKSGKTKVSVGHSVVSNGPGRAEIESMRYPFCFDSQAKTFGENLRAMLPFVDFQRRYNRFELKVSGLDAAKARVIWMSPDGKSKFEREFVASELASGVNLADSFAGTPFDSAFARYFEASWRKEQNDREYATRILSFKQTATAFTGRDVSDDLKPVFDAVFARQEANMAHVKSLHVPVRHVIEVIPVK